MMSGCTFQSLSMIGVGFKPDGTSFLLVSFIGPAKELIEDFVDTSVGIHFRLEQFADLDTHIGTHIQVHMVTAV